MTVETRELSVGEFSRAEKVWEQYRGQKADPINERIFGVFVDDRLAATARCTRHAEGLEMDCVYTVDEFRGKGYARVVVTKLVDECGSRKIFIHSTLVLISFYKTFGFYPIPEEQLPRSIRERFLFCFGEMEGCNVCPMARNPYGKDPVPAT
jgi:GNAT superfamily N-acetyltransferase